jgi:hypothetical protein
MPEIRCETCGIIVQPTDLICLKCGSSLGSKTTGFPEKRSSPDGANLGTRGKCEKCGRNTEVKYYQFLFAVKLSQEKETRPNEFLPRSYYRMGGQDGAWLCSRHRWYMPGRWDIFFQFVLPVFLFLTIPFVWLNSNFQEARIWVTILVPLVSLILLVFPLLGGLEPLSGMHAIALNKKRLMAQGWDSFFTPQGYQAWLKTTTSGGSTQDTEPTIELSDYEVFLDKLCQERNQTTSVVQQNINAYCARCGAQFTDEALSHLYLMGPKSSYRQRMGDRVVLTSTSPDGNMLRAGKCPACGCAQMKIRFKNS